MFTSRSDSDVNEVPHTFRLRTPFNNNTNMSAGNSSITPRGGGESSSNMTNSAPSSSTSLSSPRSPDFHIAGSSSNTHAEVIHRGFLSKQSFGHLNMWSKRWFVLTKDTLAYFRLPKDKKPQYEVHVATIYNVEPTSDWRNKQEFCIAIRTYGRTLFASAESREERDTWVLKLKESMSACALQGVEYAFQNLYSRACNHDELKFAELVLTKMMQQVPKWRNAYTLSTDVKRMLHKVCKDVEVSRDPSSSSLVGYDNKVEDWQIEFEDIKLKSRLAEGFFGEVYTGNLWGKEVAVKILKNKNIEERHLMKLREEVSLMIALRHPNVLLFMGFCPKEPNVCIVTEYMERGSLYNVLQSGCVTDRQLFTMVLDVCKGMNYLHNRNIIHLDIKPANLLVDHNLNVKIADLGLSKALGRWGDEKPPSFSGYCTVLYTAPEVIYGPDYDRFADVFSFGVVLYELLYIREHPNIDFSVDEGFTLLREPLSRNRDPIIPEWWLPSFKDLIFRCLRHNPKTRPTFEEIIQFLESNIAVQSDWFIQRHSAERILKLSENEATARSMIEHWQQSFWETIDTLLSVPDTETLYLTASVLVNVAELNSNPYAAMHTAVETLASIYHKPEFVSVYGTIGDFKYFETALLSPYIEYKEKTTVLEIICSLLESSESTLRLLLSQGCAEFFFRFIMSAPLETFLSAEPLHYLLCKIISNLSHASSEKDVERFIAAGGVDCLVQLATKSTDNRTQFCGLQSLADLALRDPNLASLIESKGIKPVQMASRAYLGAMLRKRVKEDEVSFNAKAAFAQNAALQKEGEELMPQLTLKFQRSLDQLSTLLDHQRSAEENFSRFFLTDTLEDEEVVEKLWNILMESDLDNLSTYDVKVRLEKEFNMEMKERQDFINKAIMQIIGQMDPPSQILDRLYLGSEWNSSNLREMKRLGIKYVLNVAAECPNYYPNEFSYHNIKIDDEEHVNIREQFKSVFNVIDKAFEEKKSVLVHCHKGMSRSATFVIAYLMRENFWTLQNASKFVKAKRSIIKPNRGFMRQLIEYDIELHGSPSLVVGESGVVIPSPSVSPTNSANPSPSSSASTSASANNSSNNQ